MNNNIDYKELMLMRLHDEARYLAERKNVWLCMLKRADSKEHISMETAIKMVIDDINSWAEYKAHHDPHFKKVMDKFKFGGKRYE